MPCHAVQTLAQMQSLYPQAHTHSQPYTARIAFHCRVFRKGFDHKILWTRSLLDRNRTTNATKIFEFECIERCVAAAAALPIPLATDNNNNMKRSTTTWIYHFCHPLNNFNIFVSFTIQINVPRWPEWQCTGRFRLHIFCCSRCMTIFFVSQSINRLRQRFCRDAFRVNTELTFECMERRVMQSHVDFKRPHVSRAIYLFNIIYAQTLALHNDSWASVAVNNSVFACQLSINQRIVHARRESISDRMVSLMFFDFFQFPNSSWLVDTGKNRKASRGHKFHWLSFGYNRFDRECIAAHSCLSFLSVLTTLSLFHLMNRMKLHCINELFACISIKKQKTFMQFTFVPLCADIGEKKRICSR